MGTFESVGKCQSLSGSCSPYARIPGPAGIWTPPILITQDSIAYKGRLDQKLRDCVGVLSQLQNVLLLRN